MPFAKQRKPWCVKSTYKLACSVLDNRLDIICFDVNKHEQAV
jgi:hypothetical protein